MRSRLRTKTLVGLTSIEKMQKKALNLYQAQDYKKDFGFIDYVSPVRRRELSDQLDALAFAELRGKMVNGGFIRSSYRSSGHSRPRRGN